MIDEKNFFQESMLRLCSDLDIGKALWNWFMYIRDFIAADYMGLNIINDELGVYESILGIDVNGGKIVSVTKPILLSVRQAYDEAAANEFNAQVMIINRLSDYVSHDYSLWDFVSMNQDSSVMILKVESEEGKQGFVGIGNNQGKLYTEEHARLFSLLQAPFAIALNNCLRHREVLRLRDMLTDESRYFQNELRQQVGKEIIGANHGLRHIMEMASQVAPLSSPVLLLGETGTGKEMIASAIHNLSPRKDGPFIKVNCGAIPATLIDSELFGHEKGAFTGALGQKRGRFERAHQGTLFLDEIGELPFDAQVRLLRVLQEKEIERVGGTETVKVDIRVIAATHRSLDAMLSEGRFREDLYFRLNVFPMVIPPLRERRGDIPVLVHHFMQKGMREMGLMTVPDLAPGTMDRLLAYNWPGNVRELQNMVERALILSKGNPLTFDALGDARPSPAIAGTSAGDGKTEILPLDETIAKQIMRSLEITGGRVGGKTGAAALLRVNPAALRKKMIKLGIPFGRKAKKAS